MSFCFCFCFFASFLFFLFHFSLLHGLLHDQRANRNNAGDDNSIHTFWAKFLFHYTFLGRNSLFHYTFLNPPPQAVPRRDRTIYGTDGTDGTASWLWLSARRHGSRAKSIGTMRHSILQQESGEGRGGEGQARNTVLVY
ncbi:hypothetical protein ACQKWADRAFT_271305 [Trichoderma austrokoningii]